MYCLFSLQPSSSSTGESKQDDDVDGEQTKCKDKEEEDTVDSSVIDEFATNMLPGCLNLVSEIPEAVYKACDLIVAISGRNGKEWRDSCVGDILSKVRVM